MDIEQLLGIRRDDPQQRLALELVAEDRRLVQELVRFRKSRMTQAACAEAMGISQGAVARIESGERDLHLSTLRRYATALGVVIRHHAEPMNVQSVNRAVPVQAEPRPQNVGSRSLALHSGGVK